MTLLHLLRSAALALALALGLVAAPAGAALEKCQRTVVKESAKFLQQKAKARQKCEDAKLLGKLPPATDCTREEKTAGKLAKAAAKIATKVDGACGGADRVCGGDLTDEHGGSALGWPTICPTIAGGACRNAIGTTSCTGIASCLACIADAAVDDVLALGYESLAPVDRALERDLHACQRALGKEIQKVVATRAKERQKCWDARLKGKHADDCPDAKAAAQIAQAETKARAKICKRCGGGDKLCGGGDDFTPSEIGFPSSCPDVTVPGGASCAASVGSLDALLGCLECVALREGTCADHAQLPVFVSYPDECRAPPPEFPLLTVAAGFEITSYATNVTGARSLARGSQGTIFVGTRQTGKVYALVDDDGDQRADQTFTIASGLNSPNGVAFRNGALYVAEIHRVLRYDAIESRLANPPAPVVVNDSFPSDAAHGWKFIRFGPDDRLYVPIGVPCNLCDPADPRYGTITRMQPDGSGFEIFAHGLRNSVGFDWDPATEELWFTDNGADGMGDDIPPDELDHAPVAGLDFGFPHCHGGTILDPTFGAGRSCSEFEPPAWPFPAHVAPLGMRFYDSTAFPAAERGQIFVAEHGSNHRTPPVGYRVSLVRLAKGRAASYEVFAEGWLQGNDSWGRPVDVMVMPDGALLVSDDKANIVYRISYRG